MTTLLTIVIDSTLLLNILGWIVALLIILVPWLIIDAVIISVFMTVREENVLESPVLLWTVLFPIALMCLILQIRDKIKDKIHEYKEKKHKEPNT